MSETSSNIQPGEKYVLCNKRNHFAAMCASKPQQSPRKRLPSNRKMVSCVDHDTDSSEEFIAMLTIKEDISDIHTDGRQGQTICIYEHQ